MPLFTPEQYDGLDAEAQAHTDYFLKEVVGVDPRTVVYVDVVLLGDVTEAIREQKVHGK